MANPISINQTLQPVIVIRHPRISGLFLTTALIFGKCFRYPGEDGFSNGGIFERNYDEFIRHQGVEAE